MLTNIVSNVSHVEALVEFAAPRAHLSILTFTSSHRPVLVHCATMRAEIFFKLIDKFFIVEHVDLGPKRISNIYILHIYFGLGPILFNSHRRLHILIKNVV